VTLRLAILDLDGTVYRGEEPCVHAPESIAALVEKGVLIRYLTNNSAAEPEAIAAKLNAMGVACQPDWVYGTGPAAARFCAHQGWRRAFVVGSLALRRSVRAAGLAVVSNNSEVVIVGICRTFTYDLLRRAQQEIRAGAMFIATNLDPTYPKEGGRFEPGAGSIVAAIATCTGQAPIVIGKPEPTIINQILADTGVSAAEALVVGDREDTDLESGRRAGVPTWLVLTGVASAPIPGQPGSPDLRGLL
jgi:4-nitrophenyl phosphatase